jgi:hypothetical protein
MTSPEAWNKYFEMLARRVAWELRDPSGDYPINPDNRRELAEAIGVARELAADHQLEDQTMSNNYFETLGQGVAMALAKARDIADQTLVDHLNPPGARDQALSRRTMPRGPRYGDQLFEQTEEAPMYNQGNGDQEPDDDNDGTGIQNPSGAQCLAFVRTALQRLPEPDRSEFLAGLTDLVGTQPADALDGRLTLTHGNGQGRPRFGDTGWLSAPQDGRSGARGTTAQDSALAARRTSAFLRRFPDAGKISTHGCGR